MYGQEYEDAISKMRDAIDKMTSSYTQALNALPAEATAAQKLLEKSVPAWDRIAQQEKLNASPELGVLLALTAGVTDAVLDFERRLLMLETHES